MLDFEILGSENIRDENTSEKTPHVQEWNECERI